MSTSAEILFKLLRIALGNESGSANSPTNYSLPSVIDWREVVDLSYQQGVAAIAVDGLQKIYDTILDLDLKLGKPELENIKYEWFGNTMTNELEYEEHCSLIAQISLLLSKNGIRMLLLKGVGCSLNYPVPSHRRVGDIDIYCFDKGVDANRVFEASGHKVDEYLGHHSLLVIGGISIENHHSLMDENNYQSNHIFEAEIHDLLCADIEDVEMQGVKILVPGPTLMALHLLRHCSGDFVSNTINVRQILDYALLVDKRSKEIDWNRVAAVVDKLGMRGFFDAMNDISVNVLNFNSAKFLQFKSDASLRERILHDTLYSKKCHDFPDYHKKLRYGIAKTRQAWDNRWKNHLVFNEGFLPLYWHKAINRLKN